jgi:glyoxylase-like metal-dependent hydrolase (beta-lactamase superfamily II)
VRAVAVHEDVIVAISAVWQTSCTAVRSGEEGFVIDSPVLPSELEALPALLEQAKFPVSGLLCTHGDWDHLLGRQAFPEATLGAGEPTFQRLAGEVGEPQRELRAFDEEWYIDGRKPLSLAGVQPLPVPGRVALGSEHEIELHPAPGHVVDGTALWLPWMGVLVCGDYLSPLEIPMISPGGSEFEYLETLKRLAPLVEQAQTVIPGHGAPITGEDAKRILAQDVAYVEELLEGDVEIRLPEGRRNAQQKKLHAENLARR